MRAQATPKRNLTQHKRSAHEGMKYPCGQCEYQVTTKESLDRHKRSIHEGINIFVINVSIKLKEKNI